jgi:hypothetical protein
MTLSNERSNLTEEDPELSIRITANLNPSDIVCKPVQSQIGKKLHLVWNGLN